MNTGARIAEKSTQMNQVSGKGLLLAQLVGVNIQKMKLVAKRSISYEKTILSRNIKAP